MCLEDRGNGMSSTHSRLAVFGLCYLLASGLLTVPLRGQAAAGDDYLLQIEAEAKQQAANPITTRAVPTPDIDGAMERLPLGLQQDDFEKVLREKFSGTYVFYERLNPQNKGRIFTLYQQDNRVSMIREQTLRLLSENVP
jgi:hypothetical protein